MPQSVASNERARNRIIHLLTRRRSATRPLYALTAISNRRSPYRALQTKDRARQSTHQICRKPRFRRRRLPSRHVVAWPLLRLVPTFKSIGAACAGVGVAAGAAKPRARPRQASKRRRIEVLPIRPRRDMRLSPVALSSSRSAPLENSGTRGQGFGFYAHDSVAPRARFPAGPSSGGWL